MSPHNDECIMLPFERMFCGLGALVGKVEDHEPNGAISLCGVGDALPRHFGGFIRFELRTKNF